MEEENIDINSVELDKLQQAIANMAENSDDTNQQELQNPLEVMEKLEKEQQNDADAKGNSEYKKYVLKINRKYQDIIDKMTNEEREHYFNAMLEFYLANQPKQELKLRIKESAINILTVVLTCVIGIPLIFFVSNKSIEATISNYKQTQTNFINLYREKGGIKKKDLTKLRNLK